VPQGLSRIRCAVIPMERKTPSVEESDGEDPRYEHE
jgi:hypothetical protein